MIGRAPRDLGAWKDRGDIDTDSAYYQGLTTVMNQPEAFAKILRLRNGATERAYVQLRRDKVQSSRGWRCGHASKIPHVAEMLGSSDSTPISDQGFLERLYDGLAQGQLGDSLAFLPRLGQNLTRYPPAPDKRQGRVLNLCLDYAPSTTVGYSSV
jgi:hypothetical protein